MGLKWVIEKATEKNWMAPLAKWKLYRYASLIKEQVMQIRLMLSFLTIYVSGRHVSNSRNLLPVALKKSWKGCVCVFHYLLLFNWKITHRLRQISTAYIQPKMFQLRLCLWFPPILIYCVKTYLMCRVKIWFRNFLFFALLSIMRPDQG